MGRFEGESCASYLLYINVFIGYSFHRFFSSSDYAELSDTFLLHGLRTEFKRKATYAVEALKPPVIMSHRFHRFTQI